MGNQNSRRCAIIITIIIEKKIISSKHIVAVNQKILRPANFPETLTAVKKYTILEPSQKH